MKRIGKVLILLAGVSLLLFLLWTCSKEEPAPPSAVEKEEPAPVIAESAAVTETEDLTPVEIPAVTQGLITFFSGDVFLLEDGEWWEVEIGDFLEVDRVLKTGFDSYCEVQFGDTAVVRIQENTEISMNTIFLNTDEANVDIDLKVGGVLAKVQKLTGNERFKVRTQTTVCGVRGTEFSVKSGSDNQTVLAVKEGAVAVLPSSVDVDALKKQVEGKGEDVLNIIKELEEAAPVVTADQEISVGEEILKETEETATAIKEAVEEIANAEEPEVSSENIARLTRIVARSKDEVARQVEPPKQISAENTEEMKQIDKMRLLEIPVAWQGDKEEAPKITLFKVSLKVTPGNAEIFLNGEAVGKGQYSGIFPEGDTLGFEITRDGYFPHTLNITTAEDTAKMYKITLAKIPSKEKVSLKVNPSDAAIVLNGETMGIGSYTGSFQVGQQLSFVIRREGFEEQTLLVDVTEGDDLTFEVVLVQKLEDITIEAEPGDAEILINGENLGTGTVTGGFPPGETLSVLVRKDGYEEQTLEINVKPDNNRPVKVSLKRLMKGIQIKATPGDAAIILAGKEVGRGSYSGSYEQGKKLSFVIQKEGFNSETLDITVTSQVKTYEVTLKPQLTGFTMNASPGDATIRLNGKVVGTGSFTSNYPKGERLSFEVSRDGYEPRTLTVTVTGDGKPVTVTLKQKPIATRVNAAGAGIVGNTVVSGSTVFIADRTGFLAAVSTAGDILWTLATKNNPNENSYPVVSAGKVYLSGARELVIIEQSSGKILGRVPLSGESAHLFGRRVVPFGREMLLPANESILVIDGTRGSTVREIPVPKGSRMTPAVWKDSIVIVDQQGTLLIIDPSGKSAVEAEIPTNAVQPVALSTTFYNDLAFFSGRKGTVVCVDLNSRKVLWERKLDTTVFNDVESGRAGVYVFSRNTIYGLSVTNGKDLFSPVSGATSPPLLDDNTLYYGKGNTLVAATAANGRVIKSTSLGDTVTARPVKAGSTVVVGTESGEIVVINP